MLSLRLRTGWLSLLFIVAVHGTAFAQNTKFSAWTYEDKWTDSPFPLQFGHLDPRAERQHPSVTSPPAATFAAQFKGHLYILGGDEPDQTCTDPVVAATNYVNELIPIYNADPTARFSPAGFAQNNVAPCDTNPSIPHYGHGTTYAQLFLNALNGLAVAPQYKRVDEWRFHRFIDPADIPGWKAEVGAMAQWSVDHGALMVLGSWGRPDVAGGLLPTVMPDLMNWINADWRIASAVWWTLDEPCCGLNKLSTGMANDPRVLTAEGQLYRTYATASVSPARSGSAELPSFSNDPYADYADYDTGSGSFWVHPNTTGSGFGGGVGPTIASFGADWDVIVADFNHDNQADYVDVHVPSGQFWVHYNTGTNSNTFNAAHSIYGTWVAGANRELLAYDFDGDGYADLIEHDLSTGQFWVRRNNSANGTFTYMNAGHEAGRTKVGPDWRTVFGDFTGDGVGDYLDVHVPSAQFWVHAGAKWDPYTSNPTNVVVSSASTGYGQGASGGSWTLIFGDFDGDGDADYADLWLATGSFWVHPNNGNGTFSATHTITGTAAAGGTPSGGTWQILGSR